MFMEFFRCSLLKFLGLLPQGGGFLLYLYKECAYGRFS